MCAFRSLISRPQVLNLSSRNQTRGKLPLSRKRWHFRGNRFSQVFIPSTSPTYSSRRKVLCQELFWVITNSVHWLLTSITFKYPSAAEIHIFTLGFSRESNYGDLSCSRTQVSQLKLSLWSGALTHPARTHHGHMYTIWAHSFNQYLHTKMP